jgi:hypothetical protein
MVVMLLLQHPATFSYLFISFHIFSYLMRLASFRLKVLCWDFVCSVVLCFSHFLLSSSFPCCAPGDWMGWRFRSGKKPSLCFSLRIEVVSNSWIHCVFFCLWESFGSLNIVQSFSSNQNLNCPNLFQLVTSNTLCLILSHDKKAHQKPCRLPEVRHRANPMRPMMPIFVSKRTGPEGPEIRRWWHSLTQDVTSRLTWKILKDSDIMDKDDQRFKVRSSPADLRDVESVGGLNFHLTQGSIGSPTQHCSSQFDVTRAFLHISFDQFSR